MAAADARGADVKLTNKLGLPAAIVNAVANDPYTHGDAHISITGLIGPARKRALEKRHAHEITEDVSDRIWSLMGQVAHGILERSETQAWTERRLYMERHGWRISGQFDRFVYEDGLLQDYKLSSTYTVRDGVKPEWEAQQNCYALLLREHGYTVNKLQIVIIFRDWQRAKARHSPDYPQHPAAVLDVPMWSDERIERFIFARLVAHSNAPAALPECTPEERWEKPGAFALMKAGNKRATSVHGSRAEAERALENAQATARKGTEFRVEARPAEQTRCLFYCPAAPFCSQWQEKAKEQVIADEKEFQTLGHFGL
jgi:hypothetical protein